MEITLELGGDKSLSHRYLIFQHLCTRPSKVSNISECADVAQTKACLQKINQKDPDLNCGNSGTTMRLLPALLSQTPGRWRLYGDQSLMTRPMNRIFDPLRSFGAQIHSKKKGHFIEGGVLKCKDYQLTIPSAQVKSCLLLCALLNGNRIKLTGSLKSRDHTEIFLERNGINIQVSNDLISIDDDVKNLKPFNIHTPGDPSSAAFLIIARLFTQGPDLQLKNILLNPTRAKYIDILQKMNAPIQILNDRKVYGEKVGDISIKSLPKGATLEGPHLLDEISFLIDEIPILSLLFLLSKGTVSIPGVSELKVKESNRINELINTFPEIQYQNESLVIKGNPNNLSFNRNHLSHDHRIFMTSQVAKFILNEKLDSEKLEISDVSFPHFFEFLRNLNPEGSSSLPIE